MTIARYLGNSPLTVIKKMNPTIRKIIIRLVGFIKLAPDNGHGGKNGREFLIDPHSHKENGGNNEKRFSQFHFISPDYATARTI